MLSVPRGLPRMYALGAGSVRVLRQPARVSVSGERADRWILARRRRRLAGRQGRD